MWLAATKNYQYAEVFRENEISGPELRQLTDTKLNQMNISDASHKQSLLLAVQELFHGDSETVNRDPRFVQLQNNTQNAVFCTITTTPGQSK